jgi:hypothetical protein
MAHRHHNGGTNIEHITTFPIKATKDISRLPRALCWFIVSCDVVSFSDDGFEFVMMVLATTTSHRSIALIVGDGGSRVYCQPAEH